MSIPYLITFKPVGPFYFGTFKSFGEGFHAISSPMPMQSTVLGCLRFVMVKQHGWIIKVPDQGFIPDFEKHKVDISGLTGDAKQVMLDSQEDKDFDFGSIRKVSPVFIVRQDDGHTCPDDFLLHVPKDVYPPGEEKPPQLTLITYDINTEAWTGGLSGINKHAALSHHDPKKYPADHYGGQAFWQSYLKGERKLPYFGDYDAGRIFINDLKEGIARENRQAKDEAFYVKEAYRMYDDYAFGVIVHFDDDKAPKNELVKLGGDGSSFWMNVSKIDDYHLTIYQNHPIIRRFLTLDDIGDLPMLFADKRAESDKLVAVSETFLNGTIEGVEHAVIPELHCNRMLQWGGLKTESFRGIPDGSVVYPLKNTKINGALNPRLMKIGYNWWLKTEKGF